MSQRPYAVPTGSVAEDSHGRATVLVIDDTADHRTYRGCDRVSHRLTGHQFFDKFVPAHSLFHVLVEAVRDLHADGNTKGGWFEVEDKACTLALLQETDDRSADRGVIKVLLNRSIKIPRGARVQPFRGGKGDRQFNASHRSSDRLELSFVGVIFPPLRMRDLYGRIGSVGSAEPSKQGRNCSDLVHFWVLRAS